MILLQEPELVMEAVEELTPTDLFPVLSEYEGFGAQSNFVLDRSSISIAGAASRTGKTYGAAEQFMNRIAEDFLKLPLEEEKVYWCIAPTKRQSVAQVKQLKRLVPDWMIDWDKMYRRVRYRENWGARFGDGEGGILYIIGNVTVELRSAHNPESLIAEKVRGIWITEIAKIKWASWSNIVERLSNYTDSWLIGDTTPMGHNWFYNEVWEKAERGALQGASIFHWTAYDSPFVSRERIEAARQNLAPEFFARGFLASFGAFYGKIYSQWSKEKHIVDKCPFKANKVLIAVDLNANTEKPAAFGEFLVGGKYVDPTKEEWARMHLSREYYQAIGLDYEGYADSIALAARRWGQAGFTQNNGRLEVVIDPSAHRQFKKMLKDRGLNYTLAKNDVKQGIMTFGGALVTKGDGKPIFTVSKGCNNFAKEINGYSWKVNSNGVALEEPDKTGDDHLLDCGRYAAMHVWNKLGNGGRVRNAA
jgi:hypothetical protein